jgi:hypothetical protein
MLISWIKKKERSCDENSLETSLARTLMKERREAHGGLFSVPYALQMIMNSALLVL